jgi:methylphosphotriester-DNA--protein-cysteine methyltransferase
MKYKLRDENNKEYLSKKPGKYGGNKKLKIYGKLDCPSALRWIAQGHYVKNRVFFKDAPMAIAAGYRPCAICLPHKYKEWKNERGL